MPVRSTEEISYEIAILKDLAERLPNARHNLRVVIQTLEDGLTARDVYDLYDTEDMRFPYAHNAAQWADGDEDTPPSDGWE